MICSSRTSTAPTGTSPAAAAARACSSATCMQATSWPASARSVMRLCRRCRGRCKEERRIDEGRIQRDSEMKMRPGDPPGRPDIADHLSRLYLLAALRSDHAQVAIHGDETTAVIENHGVAVEEEVAG